MGYVIDFTYQLWDLLKELTHIVCFGCKRDRPPTAITNEVTADTLADALTQVAPVAASAGVSAEEAAAALRVLGTAGTVYRRPNAETLHWTGEDRNSMRNPETGLFPYHLMDDPEFIDYPMSEFEPRDSEQEAVDRPARSMREILDQSQTARRLTRAVEPDTVSVTSIPGNMQHYRRINHLPTVAPKFVVDRDLRMRKTIIYCKGCNTLIAEVTDDMVEDGYTRELVQRLQQLQLDHSCTGYAEEEKTAPKIRVIRFKNKEDDDE